MGWFFDNIVPFSAFGKDKPEDTPCWLCQKSMTTPALFCPHCGSIQPLRPMDFFALLGIDPRIDIDLGLLERQYAALCRALDPSRFLLRGPDERGYAARYLEALEEAFETLRDPLRRSRYWLSLHERQCEVPAPPLKTLNELRAEFEAAKEAVQFDRVAQKAGQAMQQGIRDMMQALRHEDWSQANMMLREIDGLETLLADIRHRRFHPDGEKEKTDDGKGHLHVV